MRIFECKMKFENALVSAVEKRFRSATRSISSEAHLSGQCRLKTNRNSFVLCAMDLEGSFSKFPPLGPAPHTDYEFHFTTDIKDITVFLFHPEILQINTLAFFFGIEGPIWCFL